MKKPSYSPPNNKVDKNFDPSFPCRTTGNPGTPAMALRARGSRGGGEDGKEEASVDSLHPLFRLEGTPLLCYFFLPPPSSLLPPPFLLLSFVGSLPVESRQIGCSNTFQGAAFSFPMHYKSRTRTTGSCMHRSATCMRA